MVLMAVIAFNGAVGIQLWPLAGTVAVEVAVLAKQSWKLARPALHLPVALS